MGWKRPTPGKTKLNCDAAVIEMGRAGLGFVLRDEEGKVLLAGKTECRTTGGSTLMESLAIRYALRMILQYDLHADSVESDSKNCIEGLNGKIRPEVYCDLILQDIRELAAKVRCSSFVFVPRQGNWAAHYAAKGPDFISVKHAPSHLVKYPTSDVLP